MDQKDAWMGMAMKVVQKEAAAVALKEAHDSFATLLYHLKKRGASEERLAGVKEAGNLLKVLRDEHIEDREGTLRAVALLQIMGLVPEGIEK